MGEGGRKGRGEAGSASGACVSQESWQHARPGTDCHPHRPLRSSPLVNALFLFRGQDKQTNQQTNNKPCTKLREPIHHLRCWKLFGVAYLYMINKGKRDLAAAGSQRAGCLRDTAEDGRSERAAFTGDGHSQGTRQSVGLPCG